MSRLQENAAKMTNYRWAICAMLFFATTVNYLDRQVLSLTWDEFIKPEFHWMNHTTELLHPYFQSYMRYACYSQVDLSIGWEQKKDIYGLSVYGRPEHVYTLYAVSSPNHTLDCIVPPS